MTAPALLVIDVQKGLDDPSYGNRSTPDAESNIASLLSHWRAHGWPIVHIRHCSIEPNSLLRSDQPGNAFMAEAQPLAEETQFEKSTASAFVGTELEPYLRSQDIDSLIIVGLTTDHCVSATVRMASDLGFDVTVISDATAAHGRTAWDGNQYSADDIHTISLVTLDGEFCRVRSTEEQLEKLS